MTDIDLAARITQLAARLEEQAGRHRLAADTAIETGRDVDAYYQDGLSDAKGLIAERLRDALTAPDAKPADHHTPTEDAAGRHARQRPVGDEWLVAHKDEPDEGEVA